MKGCEQGAGLSKLLSQDPASRLGLQVDLMNPDAGVQSLVRGRAVVAHRVPGFFGCLLLS